MDQSFAKHVNTLSGMKKMSMPLTQLGKPVNSTARGHRVETPSVKYDANRHR